MPLENSLKYKFSGIPSVACVSYIIGHIDGQTKSQKAWSEGVSLMNPSVQVIFFRLFITHMLMYNCVNLGFETKSNKLGGPIFPITIMQLITVLFEM